MSGYSSVTPSRLTDRRLLSPLSGAHPNPLGAHHRGVRSASPSDHRQCTAVRSIVAYLLFNFFQAYSFVLASLSAAFAVASVPSFLYSSGRDATKQSVCERFSDSGDGSVWLYFSCSRCGSRWHPSRWLSNCGSTIHVLGSVERSLWSRQKRSLAPLHIHVWGSS